MTALSDIGVELVRLRRAQGMTQAALAERLGVKRQQVARWESVGYRTAAFESVARAAEALGWEPAPAALPMAAEAPAAYGPATATPEPETPAVAPVRDLGEIAARVRAHAAELQERYGITRIAVFGSFARGEQTPDSDVDMIVDVEEPTLDSVFGSQEALAVLLARKVDSGSLDTLRPRIRPRVEKDLVDVWRA